MTEGPQSTDESEDPVSVPDIKEEPQPVDINSTLFLPQPAASTPAKRPLDEPDTTSDGDNKRIKVEVEVSSLEDEMARLVQTALGDISSLVSQIPTEESIPDPNPVDDEANIGSAGLIPGPWSGPRPDSSHGHRTASQSHDPQITSQSHAPLFPGPWRQLQVMSLPVLGSLAVQLLLMLSQQYPDDAFGHLQDPSCEASKAYTTLLSLFYRSRALYSETSVVLSAQELDFPGVDSQNTIRLTNLASICTAIISPDKIQRLPELCAILLETILPRAVDLSPAASEVLLGLETQNALDTLESWFQVDDTESGPDKSSILDSILLGDVEAALRNRHPDSDLLDVEQNLLDDFKTRKEELLQSIVDEGPGVLDKRPLYRDALLSGLASYLDNSREMFIEDAERFNIPLPAYQSRYGTEACETPEVNMDDFSSFMERATSGLVRNALANVEDGHDTPLIASPGEQASRVSPPHRVDVTDYKELEALVAESTSHYVRNTLNGLSPTPLQSTVPTASDLTAIKPLSSPEENQGQGPPHLHPSSHSTSSPVVDVSITADASLPPNQSFPSSVLYEKARQAALSKSSTHTRREGIHSTRRPWTQEEEKALMAGLDMVKGPHWSQILSLFGTSGTMSDILKDRTQVQLKDKARNLKLFFLKTNSEMPFYLQAVTGELKTRAPTQAARKEAEERAKMNTEEEQARFQGIMTLAGGLHNPQPGRQIQAVPAQSAAATPELTAEPGGVVVPPLPTPLPLSLPQTPAATSSSEAPVGHVASASASASAPASALQRQQPPAQCIPQSGDDDDTWGNQVPTPTPPQRSLQSVIQALRDGENIAQPPPPRSSLSPSSLTPTSHYTPQTQNTRQTMHQTMHQAMHQTMHQITHQVTHTPQAAAVPPQPTYSPPSLHTPPTPQTPLSDLNLASLAQDDVGAYENSQDSALLQGLKAAVANST